MSARDFNVLAAIHGLQDRGFIIVSPVEQRAGYRILAPNELDAETVERCAQIAEKEGVHPELNVFGGGPEWYRHGKRIAKEIRSLAGSKDKEGRQ